MFKLSQVPLIILSKPVVAVVCIGEFSTIAKYIVRAHGITSGFTNVNLLQKRCIV